MKKIKIAGFRQVVHLAQIEVLSSPGRPLSIARLLAPLADQGINLEFAIALANTGLILGVQRNHVAAVLGLLQGSRGQFDGEVVRSHDPVGMISLFPHGNRPAVIGNFFSAFRDAGIQLLAISFSLSALSGLVEENRVAEALQALGDYFDLPG